MERIFKHNIQTQKLSFYKHVHKLHFLQGKGGGTGSLEHYFAEGTNYYL